MDKKIIAIVVLIITNVITISFLFANGKISLAGEPNIKSDFNGIESALGEMEKDAYFYQNFNIFSNLFNDEDEKYFKQSIKKLEDEKFLEEKVSLLVLAGIFQKDPKIKEISENAKDLYNKYKLSDKDKEELFSKNNDCAKLVGDIKDGLKDKYKNSYGSTEKEELGFIFYSPTLKACVYSTNYEYSYASGDKYYTKNSKIIYNASIQTKINEFDTYAYQYPGMKDEDIERGKKLYAKFILENSGYNADLLKDFVSGVF